MKPAQACGRPDRWRLSCLIALFVVGACAGPQGVFVLLPDSDGSTGAIEVRNDAGAQIIDRANQVTRVAGKDSRPEAPSTISEDEINKDWAAVLRAAPLAPKSFILYFRIGTDRLTADSEAQFPKIFEEIKKYPAAELSIVRHTDRLGSAKANAVLSLKRAETTLRRLVEAGLRHERVETDSHGENNPLIPTADNVAEPRNRHVEVTIR